MLLEVVEAIKALLGDDPIWRVADPNVMLCHLHRQIPLRTIDVRRHLRVDHDRAVRSSLHPRVRELHVRKIDVNAHDLMPVCLRWSSTLGLN